MSLAAQIENILRDSFCPSYLEIVNESALHAGHSGDDGSGESHFRVVVGSPVFLNVSRVERHRMIYAALEKALPAMPHALAIKAFSDGE